MADPHAIPTRDIPLRPRIGTSLLRLLLGGSLFVLAAWLFRHAIAVARHDPGAGSNLLGTILGILVCAYFTAEILRVALQRRARVVLGPETLEVVLLDERRSCSWQEVADVVVVDGSRDKPVKGVEIQVALPSGLPPAAWVTIPDVYRIRREALAEAIAAAWRTAQARGPRSPSQGAIGAEPARAQNRTLYWVAGAVILLPILAIILSLLSR